MLKNLLFLSFLWYLASTQDLPSCDSKIFCQGQLLHTVQMTRIFNDSKQFVDMQLKNDVDTTLKNFDKLMADTNNNPDEPQIRQFVNDNFETAQEFVDWLPPDYNPNPEFLSKIDKEDLKTFAKALIGIWPELARKISPEVLKEPNKFSLIPVDNGFIIPGGRFKEFYYWDSYWIVKGLLISGMTDTVRGMLDNFISMVERYGFIPNGARVYYLNRSQPPLLSFMVEEYLKYTNDIDWLKKNIKYLEAEVNFFINNRLIEITKDDVKYTVAHYASESGTPRPESYREDIRSADYYDDPEKKKQLYADLKSGAESGWDFSSRWIIDDNGGNKGNISLVKTRKIIPVDLNAILCKAFGLLGTFQKAIGDSDSAIVWNEKRVHWEKMMEKIFYDSDDGIWYDYDSKFGESRKIFYPSNFAPLWTQCHRPEDADLLGGKAASYLRKQGIMEYQGGIPTSIENTGEQWDLPNAWPPLQSITVFGLKKSGNKDAENIASELAERWLNANKQGYERYGEMFEKYDAERAGEYGGGGEYTVQSGFGWTNGVVLEMIEAYHTKCDSKSTSKLLEILLHKL